MNRLQSYFPIVEWLPQYEKHFLAGDITAGITVGVMLIPQGIAYAMIAGLPPVYGLYAALVPQLVYAVFGTSRQLAVGPVAMDSLLVASGVTTIATAGTMDYVSLTILLATMVGLLLLLFGLFRLGFVVNFLSKPVIGGFTSGAAIIIGVHQLKHIFGVSASQTTSVIAVIQQVWRQLGEVNLMSIILAAGGVLFMKTGKRIHVNFPSALVVVFLSIIVTWGFGLEKMGVQIIGTIPSGLPSFTIPIFNFQAIKSLFPMAFALSIIAFMEAISIAKGIEADHKGEYKLNNNQEMLSLGLSNLIGSFFMSYPTTGGFSRSAVNNQSGAKTNLSAVISAVLVGLVLLFFSSWFYYLPKPTLGAIILASVIGLVDFKSVIVLWKTNKQDLIMFVVTFVITLFVGIQEGISAGVFVSILMLIYRTANPHIAVLGRLSDTEGYRNKERFEHVELRRDVLVMRQDAQLFFANAIHFVDRVSVEVEKKGDELKLLVLDCASISSVDATALEELKLMIQSLNQKGIEVYFSGVIGPVRDFFHKSGFVKEIGEYYFFIDVQKAIDFMDTGARVRNKQMLKDAIQTNVFDDKLK